MNQFVLEHSANGVWYGTFPLLTGLGIKHGISTRWGGASSGPYADLDLGLHTGDDAAAVQKNRQLFCQALGLDAAQIVTAEQVHGSRVAIVSPADAGKGAMEYRTAIKDTDALVTNSVGLPLMLFFADCVPVLLVDPVHRAVGIAHAGWKGTVAKIAEQTLLTMQQAYATKPQDCFAAIGPSIGQCCYEVDEVVVTKLQAAFTYWQELLVPQGDRWRLDLWQANRRLLTGMGVPDAHITVSDVCTACNHQLFFSYRAAGGVTGRIGAVISLV